MNDKKVGNYIDFFYGKKYNIEEHGKYIEGNKIKLADKYFNEETGLLNKEISFIQLYRDRMNADLAKKYHDNQSKSYTNLKLNDDESCYYTLEIETDTLVKDNTYELIITSQCFDYEQMIVIIGEYDQYFQEIGSNFDTLKSTTNTIHYYFSPLKVGHFIVSGRIFKYKEVIVDGEEFWQGKNMYFSKEFTVNPRSSEANKKR